MNRICSCIICKQQFSVKGFYSHYTRSHTEEGNIKAKEYSVLGVIKSKQMCENLQSNKIQQYNLSPNKCVCCNKPLPYDKKRNKFCNSSCAATHNNQKINYPKRKKEQKITKTKKISKFRESVCGEYTQIYLCTCKITGIKWYSKSAKSIHPTIIETKQQYTYQCRFNFSISQFPEWFSYCSELINTYGWYSAANRKNNLTGCSRDHIYSVSEGYKNNIDPKILSHPANCQIMPHTINQTKHSSSNISLEKLLENIDKFNKMYPWWNQIN